MPGKLIDEQRVSPPLAACYTVSRADEKCRLGQRFDYSEHSLATILVVRSITICTNARRVGVRHVDLSSGGAEAEVSVDQRGLRFVPAKLGNNPRKLTLM